MSKAITIERVPNGWVIWGDTPERGVMRVLTSVHETLESLLEGVEAWAKPEDRRKGYPLTDEQAALVEEFDQTPLNDVHIGDWQCRFKNAGLSQAYINECFAIKGSV